MRSIQLFFFAMGMHLFVPVKLNHLLRCLAEVPQVSVQSLYKNGHRHALSHLQRLQTAVPAPQLEPAALLFLCLQASKEAGGPDQVSGLGM